MVLFQWLLAMTGLSVPKLRRGRPALSQRNWTHPLLLEPLVDRILPSFLPAVNYPVESRPVTVVTGDLRGDGISDLVTLTQSSVVVQLGNGDGTFLPGVSYPVAPGADTVTIGDLNGDGVPDLVIGSSAISVLLGNGDGTFQKAIETPVSVFPIFVAVADLNGDGHADLVVANGTADQVSIFLGNGDGTFQKPISYAAGSNARSVVIADFNSDGNLDIAVADEAGLGGTSGVSVLLGNGDGTFQKAVLYPTGPFPESVAVGDFNGAGIPDLVTANSGDNTVSILLGVGDGTFQPATQVNAGIRGLSVAVADFNGDGLQDLAVAGNGGLGSQDSGVAVLLGNGDGTFQTPTRYAADLDSQAVAVADFNGDGYPDLAVANGMPRNISVLLNAADWSGPQTPVSQSPFVPISVGLPIIGDPILGRPVGCPIMEHSPDGDDPDLTGAIAAPAPLEFRLPAPQTAGAREGIPLATFQTDHVFSLISLSLAEPAPLGVNLFPV